MQNIGIKWTPGNIALNQYMGLYVFQNAPNGAPGLTSLIIHRTTTFEQFDLEFCLNLTSVSFPELMSIQGAPIPPIFMVFNPVLATVSMPVLGACGALTIHDNPMLTSIDVSSMVPDDGANYDFSANALNQTTVDLILHRCVLKLTWAQHLNLGGGINSTPSATGLADKATLIGRGANVTTN